MSRKSTMGLNEYERMMAAAADKIRELQDRVKELEDALCAIHKLARDGTEKLSGQNACLLNIRGIAFEVVKPQRKALGQQHEDDLERARR